MHAQPEKFLTQGEVLDLIPYSRVQLWRKIKDGSFPAPLQIGARRRAWRESDIARWQASCQPVAYAATAASAA